MSNFLITVGVGLATAAILALSAVAFTLEYAVSRVVNFAHGELLTIGAYAAYSGQHIFHQNVVAAAVIAAVAGLLAGLALNVFLIERFRGRTATTVFIATLGVSLIVQNVLTMMYGAANVTYYLRPGRPAPGGTIPLDHIGHRGHLLGCRRWGPALPAAAAHPVGEVDQGRVAGQVPRPGKRYSGRPGGAPDLGLAGAVAGFAGFVLADTIGTFGTSLGFSFLLLTITASVAGGIGRPYPTLAGALLVGVVVQIGGAYTSSAYQQVYAFLMLVLLMLLRPNGLFVRSAAAVRA